ncbi:hypothetical protein LTR95_000154 [Oleoguttula sp. CCFEE 5521]
MCVPVIHHFDKCGHQIKDSTRCFVAIKLGVANCGIQTLSTRHYHDRPLCAACRVSLIRTTEPVDFRTAPANYAGNQVQKPVEEQNGNAIAGGESVEGAVGDTATPRNGGFDVTFANAIDPGDDDESQVIVPAATTADEQIRQVDEAAAGQQVVGIKVVTSIEQQFDSRLPTPSGLPDPTEGDPPPTDAQDPLLPPDDPSAVVEQDANAQLPPSQTPDPSIAVDREQEDPDAWITQSPPGPVHPPVAVVDPKDTTLKLPPRYSPPAPPRLENAADDADDPNPWTPHGLSTRPGDEHDRSGYREWEVRVKERNDQLSERYVAEHRANIKEDLKSDRKG